MSYGEIKLSIKMKIKNNKNNEGKVIDISILINKHTFKGRI